MRRIVLCLALLLVFLSANLVQAEIYTLPISVIGDYGSEQVVSADFGQSFASIQSLSISWSGQVKAGSLRIVDSSGMYQTWPAYFKAVVLSDSGSNAVANANTPALGYETAPNPQSFDFNNQFTLNSQYNWDVFLDGQASISLRLSGVEYPMTRVPSSLPTGRIDSAVLILDATPVPEPASLFTLAFGVVGLGVRTIRRRL